MENNCKCGHHKVVPICIILIGLTFLLLQMDILTASAAGIIWPILLIAVGVVKIVKCKCC